jgi:AcrR family transcriptional regulator
MDARTADQPTPTLRPGIAERLWQASRVEFSTRGYHGARVQGIARRAGCNVALLYRHWSSKKALYLDVLRSIYTTILGDMARLMERGQGAPAVVSAYLDAYLRDPLGAQIIVREVLDGGPFLGQLIETEPALLEPMRRAATVLQTGDALGLRQGLDPALAVITIGGLSALASSAHEATRPFLPAAVPVETWRAQLYEIVLHGLVPCPVPGAAAPHGD